MGNWYKQADGMYENYNRHLYNVKLSIWVPRGFGPEDAYNVLKIRMEKMTGWTMRDTPGINANIILEGMEELE